MTEERPTSAPPAPPASAASPPPPPPAPAGSDAESRATAATWVAAVGAVLLLAAAGTFLAVSWDALGLPARIAVIGAGTGAAILGGHRLRRTLPAVGAVVFHLGALLVPVDALGLALQLGAGTAARWTAVGTAAVLALPPLALAGRSRVLAWAAVVGVPVLATGIGLAGGPAAPLATAVAALVAMLLVVRGGVLVVRGGALDGVGFHSAPGGPAAAGVAAATRAHLAPVTRAAGALLAAIAVHVPLLAAIVVATPGTGGVSAHLRQAGWVPSTWTTTAVWTSLAVVALVVAATRHRSTALATLALVSAGVGAVTTLLPAGTPRLAVLVGVPTLALVVEVATHAARSDQLWSRPLRWLAGTVELAGVPVAVVVAVVAVDPLLGRPDLPDTEVAAGLAVAALVWLVASLRRVTRRGATAGLAPVLLGLATLHLAVAAVAADAPANVPVVALLLGGLATIAWTELGRDGEPVPVAPAHVAALTGVALAAVGAVHATGTAPTLIAVAALVALTAVHIHAGATAQRTGATLATWALLPIGAIAAVGASAVPARGDASGQVVALLVTLLGLTLLAAAADRVEPAGDVARGILALVGVVALLPVWPAPTFAAGGNALGVDAVVGLALLPTALVPAALATLLLTVDALRTRRTLLAALVVPVALRTVIAASLAAGLTVTATAIVVLTLAVAGGVPVVLGTPRWQVVGGTLAGLAGPVGLLLVGDARLVRAGLLIAAGGLLVLAAVVRRHPWVGHVGGAMVTVGVWDLLGALEVTALDVWVLPLAAHLWVAGVRARHAGTVTSSWAIDVPPLLLVVVPALLERATGGGGWHAVLAGAVALGAIVLGGMGRHGGPLLIGTLALVTVVLIEVFAVVAAVPTWVWLALGGAALLGAAAVIERSGGTPVRAARRLLDVVTERFD